MTDPFHSTVTEFPKGRIVRRPGDRPASQGLKPGGGGGTYDGMWEQSVENRLGELAKDMSQVKTDVATLVERVSHLPSKGFMVRSVLGTLAVITALILFADQIKAVFHIS